MKFTTVVGLLIVLIVCSCAQQTTKGVEKIEDGPSQHPRSSSGLMIEHGGYRGTGYTDSLGANYNLRYSPITITNDNTVPIQVQLEFERDYDYPAGYGDEKFRVFPLPKEWAQDGTTDRMFDRMWEDFENHIDKPFLNETIEPGEQLVFAIGTLYPLPAESWWITPNKLFAHSDGELPPTCDWLVKADQSSIPIATGIELELRLKLDHDQSCKLIPCGRISYPE